MKRVLIPLQAVCDSVSALDKHPQLRRYNKSRCNVSIIACRAYNYIVQKPAPTLKMASLSQFSVLRHHVDILHPTRKPTFGFSVPKHAACMSAAAFMVYRTSSDLDNHEQDYTVAMTLTSLRILSSIPVTRLRAKNVYVVIWVVPDREF